MCLLRPAVCAGACNAQSEGRTKAWAHRIPYGWSPWGAGDDREVGGSHEGSCKPCEGGDEGPREPAWWPVVQIIG